jgi:hypothetical protein
MGIAKTSMSDSPSQIFRSVLPQVWGLYLGLRRKTPCGISFGDNFLSQFCTQGIKKKSESTNLSNATKKLTVVSTVLYG